MALKYSPEKYVKIEKKTLELLIDYGYVDFPIDIFKLAKEAFDAEIIPYSNLPKEKLEKLGEIGKLDDSFTIFENMSDGTSHYKIYYNDKKPYYRQRYSIGHEIKHIIYNEQNPTEEEEDFAEYFSKVLIAPKCMVILFDVSSSAEITEKFQLGPQPAGWYFEKIQKRIASYGKEMFDYERNFLEDMDIIIESRKKD